MTSLTWPCFAGTLEKGTCPVYTCSVANTGQFTSGSFHNSYQLSQSLQILEVTFSDLINFFCACRPLIKPNSTKIWVLSDLRLVRYGDLKFQPRAWFSPNHKYSNGCIFFVLKVTWLCNTSSESWRKLLFFQFWPFLS